MRQLAPLQLDAWLENWGRWLGCDLSLGIQVSEIDYNSPQGPHWAEPLERYVRPPDVHEHPAQLVETLVHAPEFHPMWTQALRAAFYLWPSSRLSSDHVQTSRWEAKRARSASQSLPTYLASIQNGKTRLGRDLYVWRHFMPAIAA